MAARNAPSPDTQDESNEWIGGACTDPHFEAAGDGAPPPQLLFWIDGEGNLLSWDASPAEELAQTSVETLQAAMAREDAPPRPERLRVAAPELAEALQAAYPDLEVSCGPTPELERIGALIMSMDTDPHPDPRFDMEDLDALFTAAATLFRAEPWRQSADEQMLLSITVEDLGLHGAVLLVSGQKPQDFSFILFESADEFQKYVDIETGTQPSEGAPQPSYFGFHFSSEDALSPEGLAAFRKYGWELASPIAYPTIIAFEGKTTRPPSQGELVAAEAAALTLAQFMVEETGLKEAWPEDRTVCRTYTLPAYGGELEASICAPYQDDFDTAFIEDFEALSTGGGPIDHERRTQLQERLIVLFDDAPESRGLDTIGFCRTVMDFSANYFGRTLLTLDAGVLSRVLFELFPRKLCIQADEATDIILELRAFFKFLKRELRLPQADACLRLLSEDALDRLEAELSNPANFSNSKGLFMDGVAAGYDMESEEGQNAWRKVVQDRLRPTSEAPRSASKKAAKAKKKRKAARKARKKNR